MHANPRPAGRLRLALAGCALAVAASPAAAADPVAAGPAAGGGPVALVLAAGAYAARPLPACVASAGVVAAALRRAGFAVAASTDGSNGEVAAAIAGLARRITGPPAVPALVYACGLVATYEGRGFLLPAAARLARGADVLTQGVLVASLRRTLAAAGAPAGLLLLDAVRPPDGDAGADPAVGLEALAQAPALPGQGLLAAVGDADGPGPAPLARALAAGLGPAPEVGALIGTLRQALAGQPALAVLQQRPPAPAWLGPPPAPEAPAVAAVAPPAPVASVAAAPPVGAASSAAGASPATVVPPGPAVPPAAAVTSDVPGPPDEARMGTAQRRGLQAALSRLGYYDGRPDGVFGADTRAAIRRFQHELAEPMTGRLTAAQAGRLADAP